MAIPIQQKLRDVPGDDGPAPVPVGFERERRSGRERPDDAYVVIRYRNWWFWIDDRDLLTKRNFAFLMRLFSLADTGSKQPLPIITIPAQ